MHLYEEQKEVKLIHVARNENRGFPLRVDGEGITDYKGTQGAFWSAENVVYTLYAWQAHRCIRRSRFIKLYT